MKKKEPKALELETKFWRMRANELEEKKTRTEIIINALKSSLSVIKPLSRRYRKPRTKKHSAEELVVLLSDAQAGTKVVGEEIGNPEWNYDTNIFRYRLRVYLDGIMKVVNRQRMAYPVDEVTIWLGGDLLENERTFLPQMTFIDTNVINQFYMVQFEVARFLSIVASLFHNVKVVCSPGNHGRVGTTKEHSDFVNWEYLLYRNLKFMLGQHRNMDIDVPLAWYKVVNVNGTRIMFIHAEDVIRYMSIPWYGLDRFAKSWSQAMQSIGTPFEVMCIGHFHQSFNQATSIGEMFCNGSFVGYTRFVQKKLHGAGVRPSQTIFFVHPKMSITGVYKIKLDIKNERLWKETMDSAYDIDKPVSHDQMATLAKDVK